MLIQGPDRKCTRTIAISTGYMVPIYLLVCGSIISQYHLIVSYYLSTVPTHLGRYRILPRTLVYYTIVHDTIVHDTIVH